MIRTRLQGDTPFFPNMLNNGNIEVCLKEDVDKVLADKDKEIAELKEEIDSIKVKFRKFNDNVCRNIVDASRTISAISQDALMDFYEKFIKEAK